MAAQPTLPASRRRLLARPLVRGALRVRRSATLAGDLALPRRRDHRKPLPLLLSDLFTHGILLANRDVRSYPFLLQSPCQDSRRPDHFPVPKTYPPPKGGWFFG